MSHSRLFLFPPGSPGMAELLVELLLLRDYTFFFFFHLISQWVWGSTGPLHRSNLATISTLRILSTRLLYSLYILYIWGESRRSACRERQAKFLSKFYLHTVVENLDFATSFSPVLPTRFKHLKILYSLDGIPGMPLAVCLTALL